MSNDDSMLEVYIYENQQLLDNLEGIMLSAEKDKFLAAAQVNEVFRIMHTIKGSSSMMEYNNLFQISNAVEDLFSIIRDDSGRVGDWEKIFDLVLNASDFIKAEMAKLSAGQSPDGDPSALAAEIHAHIKVLSEGRDTAAQPAPPQAAASAAPAAPAEAPSGAEAENGSSPFYKIKLSFDPECKMENVRAFGVVQALSGSCSKIAHIPEDINDNAAAAQIAANGFVLYVQSSANPDSLKKTVEETLFLHTYSLIPIEEDNPELPAALRPARAKQQAAPSSKAPTASLGLDSIAKQNFISVNVNKLDSLLDLVGELVTTESMVVHNPDLENLQLNNFETAAHQLKSLTSELQDIVMSIRMLPVSNIFHKMQRIVRDMSKKVSKDINLVLIGEETEVDKNIIDSLSDPLMHLIRNAVDHGIEPAEERVRKGKPAAGQVTLEAQNTGGDVIITVSDDGGGLDRHRIIDKAIEKGLVNKAEKDITDKEAFSYIFLPGFSTNEEVTEYSGRGVGMDVVRRGIEKLGGSISVDSHPDQGTQFSIRIPLTLAIMDGMKLTVGPLSFIIPMPSIRESFIPDSSQVFHDPDGNEMIMLRGDCYPVLRLYDFFQIDTEATNLEDGILIMVETDTKTVCVFADELVGEQQVVVKPLPAFIKQCAANLRGIGGCTILGDGSISLIIDANSLLSQI